MSKIMSHLAFQFAAVGRLEANLECHNIERIRAAETAPTRPDGPIKLAVIPSIRCLKSST